MLGACAEAERAKSNTMTTRTPDRAQHCRGKQDRFIVTSLQDVGEVAGCMPCTSVTATPARNRTLTPVESRANSHCLHPVLILLKNPATEKPGVHHSFVFHT